MKIRSMRKSRFVNTPAKAYQRETRRKNLSGAVGRNLDASYVAPHVKENINPGRRLQTGYPRGKTGSKKGLLHESEALKYANAGLKIQIKKLQKDIAEEERLQAELRVVLSKCMEGVKTAAKKQAVCSAEEIPFAIFPFGISIPKCWKQGGWRRRGHVAVGIKIVEDAMNCAIVVAWREQSYSQYCPSFRLLHIVTGTTQDLELPELLDILARTRNSYAAIHALCFSLTAEHVKSGFSTNGNQNIGIHVRRSFNDSDINGVVVAWSNYFGTDEVWYKVLHDDGDLEDLDEKELKKAIASFEQWSFSSN